MSIAQKIIEKVRLRLLLRDEFESLELRRYFESRWNIRVGLYSYGCFDRWRIPLNTSIGRYCSFAKTARIVDANHPSDALTTHPFLYERKFGVVAQDSIHPPPTVVEDDVWMGANAVVTPSCKHIGRGAIIGAGTVVTKDVPAYAVVVGNPGRVLRPRFSPELIEAVEASRWWTLSKTQLAEVAATMPEVLFSPSVASLAGLPSAQRSEGHTA